MLQFLIEIVDDLERLSSSVQQAVDFDDNHKADLTTVQPVICGAASPPGACGNNNETTPLAFSTLLGVSSSHGAVSVTLIVVIGALLSLLTTGGNMLVIVSFKMDKHLQTINNYFLLSLAVADFVVGCVSIPLMTVYTAAGSWPLGYEVCQLWLNVDYMMSNASVLNLLLISTDRFLSVTMPLTYRPRRTKKRAIGMIVLTYVISSILWPPWIISWPYIEGKFISPKVCIIQFLVTNPYVTLGTACAAFYVPVTIMVILYTKVYRITKQRGEAIKRLQGFHKRSMCFARATNTHLQRSKAINTLPVAAEISSSGSDVAAAAVVANVPEEEEEDDDDEGSDDNGSDKELEMALQPTEKAKEYCVPEVKINVSSPVRGRLKMKLLPSWRLRSDRSMDGSGSGCPRRFSQQDGQPKKRVLRFSQVLDIDNFTQYQKSPVNECTNEGRSSMLLMPSNDQNSTSTIDGSMFVKEDIYNMIAVMDQERSDIENRLGALSDSMKNLGIGSGNARCESTPPDIAGSDKRYPSLPSPNKPLLCQLLPSFLAMTVASRSESGSRVRQKLAKMNQNINMAAKLRRSESKAAKMLSAILLAFIFTWLPYNVIVLVEAFFPLTVPPILFTLSYYLCYLNSTINPFCYALCNRAFRRTYVRVLTCKWKQNFRPKFNVHQKMAAENNG